MKAQSLSLDLIRIDADTQSRLALNPDTVDDYSEVLGVLPLGEWPFPPLDVFHDGSEYFLGDGFHRVLGALRAGRASAPCVVQKGTAKDARIFAMTANDRHGLRLSRADKRANVVWLLEQEGKMTQKEIAAKAGVDISTVKRIVAERNPASISGTVHFTQDNGKGSLNPSTPVRGDSSVADDDPLGDAFPDVVIESTLPEKPANGQPPKQYDRSFWYKQWTTSIGPLVRLVDKIANEVGEKHLASHKAVKTALEAATKHMMQWMKVK